MDDDVTLINFEGLVSRAQLGLIDGLNQAALEFAGQLAAELPPGTAAKSIVIKPTQINGNNYSISVGIEDQGVLKYLWGYWKGIPNIITINAHGKAMRFSRWNNGPEDLRSADGNFYFSSVDHEYLPHDFVERAMAKFTQLADRIIEKFQASVE